MTARTSILLLLLALAVSVPACGGDDDIDCTYDDSCGGDPTGEWDVAGACAAPVQSTIEDCPQAIITQSTAVGGDWTFQEDLDFSYELSTSSIYSVRAPLTCLRQEEQQVATCEELSGAGIVCTTSAEVCDCNQITTTTSELAGTWSAVGSTLTLADEFGSILASYDFCRQDDKVLKLVPSTFEDTPTVLVLEQ
jgi:hypothetical protein